MDIYIIQYRYSKYEQFQFKAAFKNKEDAKNKMDDLRKNHSDYFEEYRIIKVKLQ